MTLFLLSSTKGYMPAFDFNRIDSFDLRSKDASYLQSLFQRNVNRRPTSMVLDPIKLMQRRCNCYDLFNQQIPYVKAWEWQKLLVKTHIEGLRDGKKLSDAILVMQHPPVYTMGTRSSEEFLLFKKESPPFDLYKTERGGEVTYHGPGQLVMYPILNLRHHRRDIHWYLRSLEEIVIQALWKVCSLEARRIEGLTGVWVGDHKVAAIGVRVSKWISYHGLAVNVNTDLSAFKNIVPCGISDRPVGNVAQLFGAKQKVSTLEDNSGGVSSTLISNIGGQDTSLIDILHTQLLSEFGRIFELDLVYVNGESMCDVGLV